MNTQKCSAIGVYLVIFVAVLSGCATANSQKWDALDKQLAIQKTRRSLVRTQLTLSPASSEASALSAEIAELNREVTKTERALGYWVSEPVTTEPIPVAYVATVPSVRRSSSKVASSAWLGLSVEDRTLIAQEQSIETLEPSRYGVILESQTVDESSAGTTGGAAIGSALAQTTYIDRAFRNGNRYSSTQQLGLGILGAIVGSTLDKGPQAIFRTRYSVKLADGSIHMTDDVKSDPFRLPVTACVQFPSLDMTDQALCTQTPETLRRKFLGKQ